MLRSLSLTALLAAALVAAPASAQTLSEVDAIRRAVAASPTLRAAVADVRGAEASLDGARRATVPTFTLGGQGGYSEAIGATAEGTVFNPAATGALSAGMQMSTPLGTTIDVGVGGTVSYRETNRDPSTTQRVIVGPYYGVEASVTVRQPLLAGTDSYGAAVDGARASRDAANHQREATASALLREVSAAYWELWYADRSLAVQLQAQRLAAQQHTEALARAEQIGSLAPSETLRFASELASIEESLLEADANRQVAAIELARLLGVRPASLEGLTVDAAPPAVPEASGADLEAQALAGSPELLSLQLEVEAVRQRLRGSADAARPQLDIWARAGVSSLYSDTTTDPFSRPAMSAMVGLDFAMPLERSARDAAQAQIYAQLDAAELRYEARTQALQAEVASALARLSSADRRTALASRTAELATELAEAEAARLELGQSTPLELVAAQQSARQSELRYLRALVDHIAASRTVDHLAGGLVALLAPNLHLDA